MTIKNKKKIDFNFKKVFLKIYGNLKTLFLKKGQHLQFFNNYFF